MTPDMTARIEAAARECLEDQTICECKSCQSSAIEAVTKALTTLAESIISEKDAEIEKLKEPQRIIDHCGSLVAIQS